MHIFVLRHTPTMLKRKWGMLVHIFISNSTQLLKANVYCWDKIFVKLSLLYWHRRVSWPIEGETNILDNHLFGDKSSLRSFQMVVLTFQYVLSKNVFHPFLPSQVFFLRLFEHFIFITRTSWDFSDSENLSCVFQGLCKINRRHQRIYILEF